MHWVVVWLSFCCLMVVVARAQDFSISVPDASCNSGPDVGIKCDHDAHDVDGHIELTADSRQNSGTASTGYVFIQKQVRMLDPATRQAASFSSTLTFNITRSENSSGDGMAFVMFANGSYRGDAGGTLGVYQRTDLTYLPGTQGTKTFCVEYDTYLNPGLDPNDNHIGVDLENITSKVTEDAGRVGINLKGGYMITSWIDYSFEQLLLEVRIANASQAKPTNALISYHLDLSTIVDENMSVGIAGSTGGNVEYHQLWGLNFTAFGLPQTSSSPTSQPMAAGSHGSKSGKVGAGVIAGIAGGVAAVLGLLCLGCCTWYIRAKRSGRSLSDEFQFELAAVDMPYRFSYKQLSVATNGFSENSKLGEGGTSSVYRGVLASTGAVVAVKRVANRSKQGEKDFMGEIRVVSRLRHRNLVKLLGWCTDRGNFLLVYELMPNGSLDKQLFDEREGVSFLTWTRRLAIVRGVAAALAYLHEGYAQQVIHRDIKSSNVLLDEDYNARLGDFGLARLIEHSKNPATTQLAGTIGYIAPEAVMTWKSTDKTDVYAFGALSLEVACARRPIDLSLPPEQMILVDWVWQRHAQGRILSAVDPRLVADGNLHESEVRNILLMGLLCSHPDADARPSMREVELFLEGHRPLPPVPLNKPVPLYSASTQLNLRELAAEAKLPPHSPSSATGSGSVFSSSTASSASANAPLISF